MKEITEPEMLHRMAAYCTKAERCEQDVRKKIEAAGLPADAAGRIINRLREERFIDEARYARSFVSDKARFNKWGRVKINYELLRKGIPANIRAEAIDTLDERAYRDTLMELLRNKKKETRGKNGREVSAKLLRFAASRGFEGEIASNCLRNLLNGSGYDEYEGIDEVVE